MKRAFDLFAGVLLLSSLVIIMLFIAIAIRRTSKGWHFIGLIGLVKIMKFLKCQNLDQC